MDLTTLVVASFVIGALVPQSPIAMLRMSWAMVSAVVLYVSAMWLLKEADDESRG